MVTVLNLTSKTISSKIWRIISSYSRIQLRVTITQLKNTWFSAFQTKCVFIKVFFARRSWITIKASKINKMQKKIDWKICTPKGYQNNLSILQKIKKIKAIFIASLWWKWWSGKEVPKRISIPLKIKIWRSKNLRTKRDSIDFWNNLCSIRCPIRLCSEYRLSASMSSELWRTTQLLCTSGSFIYLRYLVF